MNRLPSGRPLRGRARPLGLLILTLSLALAMVSTALWAGVPASLSSLRGERFVLSNGLRVILLPGSEGSTIAISTAYGYGPAFEGRGEEGGALILWNLLSQGGKDIPSGALPQLLRQRGGRSEAHIGPKSLSFTTRYPANEVAFALWLESQRLRGLPSVLPEVIPAQDGAIAYRSPLEMASLMAGSALLRGPALSSRRVPMNAGGIRALHKRYITPNNAVLTLIGSSDTRRVLAKIQRYFGDIPRGVPLPPGGADPRIKGPFLRSIGADSPPSAYLFAYRLGDPWNPNLPALRLAVEALFSPSVGSLNQPEALSRLGLSQVRGWIEPTSDGALLKGSLVPLDNQPDGIVTFFQALESGDNAPLGSVGSRDLEARVWERGNLAQALSLSTLASNHGDEIAQQSVTQLSLDESLALLRPFLKPEGRSVMALGEEAR